MARAVYQHELCDPDYAWLLARFQESHPGFCYVESSCLPLVFLQGGGASGVQIPEVNLPESEEHVAAFGEGSMMPPPGKLQEK